MQFLLARSKGMENRFTVLENRTLYNIEIRAWVHPARPDKFKKIVRIKPGRSITVKATTFNSRDHDNDHGGGLEDEGILLMVYANGGWTGRYILPLQLFAYAKVSCDRNQHGQVILRAKRANFNFFRRLKCFATCAAKCVGSGMVEEDI